MKLTPFEKAAIKRQHHLLFVAAIEATQTIKELADECEKQIDDWQDMLELGPDFEEEREAMLDLATRALKDNKQCNRVFVELANTLEDKFGINA